MADNYKIYKIIYVLCMMGAFTTRFGVFELGNTHQLVIGLLWICLVLFHIYTTKGVYTTERYKTYVWSVKAYLLPHFLIYLYSGFLMLLGKVSTQYFSTNMTVFIPTMVALCAVYEFGNKTIVLTWLSFLLSWVVSLISFINMIGFRVIPHALIQAYIDHYTTFGGVNKNYLEIHDLVLAAGYFVVYIIYSNLKVPNKVFYLFLGTALIMVLGMKRISAIGIILAFLFYILLKCIKSTSSTRLCRFAGIFAFIFCYFFVWSLKDSSIINRWISSLGGITAGRNYYYSAIMKYADFSPTFLGVGRNVVSKIFTTDLSYLRVGGAHSDILKMYVENGFVVFGFWLWYYLLRLTTHYKNRFGKQASQMYFGLLIYTFTLFLTDNTEVYFICQIIQIILPLSFAIQYNDKFNDNNSIVCTTVDR